MLDGFVSSIIIVEAALSPAAPVTEALYFCKGVAWSRARVLVTGAGGGASHCEGHTSLRSREEVQWVLCRGTAASALGSDSHTIQ